MPNAMPGAAITTPQSGHTPALPLYSAPHHAHMVWVYSALANVLNAERLIELDCNLSSKGYRTALIGGIAALEQNAREYFREARNDGQLLFCWHGTTSLEVPA